MSWWWFLPGGYPVMKQLSVIAPHSHLSVFHGIHLSKAFGRLSLVSHCLCVWHLQFWLLISPFMLLNLGDQVISIGIQNACFHCCSMLSMLQSKAWCFDSVSPGIGEGIFAVIARFESNHPAFPSVFSSTSPLTVLNWVSQINLDPWFYLVKFNMLQVWSKFWWFYLP